MILLGDCIERLKELEDNSVDSVVTDPPYGLKFMGKKWDYDVPSIAVWTEIARVLKPGGHVLSFGGTRTYHRMVCVIEDAGLEIRDTCCWHYGQGFPKSLAIDKAIDRHLGAEREVIGEMDVGPDMRGGNFENAEGRMIARITKPSTPEAHRYKGWGTALKPSTELIALARKPLEKGLTVAENMLKWGVGGLNIDESRIAGEYKNQGGGSFATGKFANSNRSNTEKDGAEFIQGSETQGRWPANLLLDEESAALLDLQVGKLAGGGPSSGRGFQDEYVGGKVQKELPIQKIDKGGFPSRFFYVAKASKRERNAGLEGMPEKPGGSNAKGYTKDVDRGIDRNRPTANHHPTVKPIKLMEYLCKLITPAGGLILDPFAGSGSTGVAAFKNNFKFIGIEQNADYVAIANKRIAAAKDIA